MDPKIFFDLSQFEHAALFIQDKPVWEALVQLAGYLKRFAHGKISGEVSPCAWLVNPESIVIGEGTIVEPGAYIQGPCIIGKRCQIRHGAYIRGETIIGDACVIGHATEVKHSIFLNGAKAPHFNYVGDSILGNDVNLGAGVKCANVKLDHSEIAKTGLKKMGAVIGDLAQLGCNAVTSPGTLIGRQAVIYPCVNVHGYILDRERVKKCS